MKNLFSILIAMTLSFLSFSQFTVGQITNNENTKKALILGKSGGSITKDLLLRAETLDLSMSEQQITSFVVSTSCKNKEPRAIFNDKNNEITKEIKDLIGLVELGCNVYFEKIKLGTKKIPAIVFKID